MEFQCPTPEELVVFYAQNHASKKLAKSLWYRTQTGHFFKREQDVLRGHACFSFRTPWPLIRCVYLGRIPMLRRFEQSLFTKGILRNMELSSILVCEKRRKTGIGQTLLDQGIRYAKKMNCQSVDLLVRKDMPFLIRWYRENGFHENAPSPVPHKLRLVRMLR